MGVLGPLPGELYLDPNREAYKFFGLTKGLWVGQGLWYVALMKMMVRELNLGFQFKSSRVTKCA